MKSFLSNKRPVVNLDGTRRQILPPDLDGDGKVGGVEQIKTPIRKEVNLIQQKSELGEVTAQMNVDEIESDIGMSSMDKMSRLHPVQIPAIAIWDYLRFSNFLPESALHVSRQIKRLEVSREGAGRAEYVDVVGRKNQTDGQKTGLGHFAQGFFGGNKDKPQ